MNLVGTITKTYRGGGGEGVLVVVRAVILHLCTLVSFAGLYVIYSSGLSLVVVVFACSEKFIAGSFVFHLIKIPTFYFIGEKFTLYAISKSQLETNI